MGTRLSFNRGNYTGTNATRPPQTYQEGRDPTIYDFQGYVLLDQWLNTETQIPWVLVSLEGNATSKGPLAKWVSYGSLVDVFEIHSDTGPNAEPVAGLINIISGLSTINSGSSVEFNASGNTVQLNITDVNGNTLIGSQSGNLSITGIANTAVGFTALNLITSGIGNTALGSLALSAIAAGAGNIAIGASAGSNYTTTESFNILLNNTGVISESNTLRIGTATGTGVQQLSSVYIAGINGNTVSNPVFVTINTATDQLGTTSQSAFSNSFPTDVGTATPVAGVLNIITGLSTLNCGSSVFFSGSSNTVQLQVTDVNDNTIIGITAGNASISGSDNVSLGYNTLHALTSGNENVAIGTGALEGITSGTTNVAIGNLAGSFYTGTETSNILIGESVTGTIGESNITRIGTGQSACYVSGIDGVNVGSVATVVTEASNQLGTAVITAGTGISVTPGANTITIANTSIDPALNCAFLAYNNADISSFGSAGSFTTVPFPATVFNLGSNYNTGTYVFTAPATGYYYLYSNISVFALDSTDTEYSIQILITGTSAGAYLFANGNGYAIKDIGAGGSFAPNVLIMLPMTSGDTAKVQFLIGPGGATLPSISGKGGTLGSQYRTVFGGWRVA
jgi:hypothetical protein